MSIRFRADSSEGGAGADSSEGHVVLSWESSHLPVTAALARSARSKRLWWQRPSGSYSHIFRGGYI